MYVHYIYIHTYLCICTYIFLYQYVYLYAGVNDIYMCTCMHMNFMYIMYQGADAVFVYFLIAQGCGLRRYPHRTRGLVLDLVIRRGGDGYD